MGQHKVFEALPVFGIQIVQRLPPISDASVVRTVQPMILFSTAALLWRTCEERHERVGIWNKTGAASVWMNASTFKWRCGQPPSRAATPNGTWRFYRRGTKSQ
jgi:hypothetical protein